MQFSIPENNRKPTNFNYHITLIWRINRYLCFEIANFNQHYRMRVVDRSILMRWHVDVVRAVPMEIKKNREKDKDRNSTFRSRRGNTNWLCGWCFGRSGVCQDFVVSRTAALKGSREKERAREGSLPKGPPRELRLWVCEGGLFVVVLSVSLTRRVATCATSRAGRSFTRTVSSLSALTSETLALCYNPCYERAFSTPDSHIHVWAHVNRHTYLQHLRMSPIEYTFVLFLIHRSIYAYDTVCESMYM